MNHKNILVDHYEDPYHRGSCEHSSHESEQQDAATGCQLRVELCVAEDQVIKEIWWDGEGCLECEGFASFLAHHFEGRELDNCSIAELQSELTEDQDDEPSPCLDLAWRAFQSALHNEAAQDIDPQESTGFGGPSLGEES